MRGIYVGQREGARRGGWGWMPRGQGEQVRRSRGVGEGGGRWDILILLLLPLKPAAWRRQNPRPLH